jgi:hypothetical protein
LFYIYNVALYNADVIIIRFLWHRCGGSGEKIVFECRFDIVAAAAAAAFCRSFSAHSLPSQFM